MLDVHAGTYVEVFLLLVCKIGGTDSSVNSFWGNRRRAREPTDAHRSRAVEARGLWNAYLENLPREPHSSEESAAGGAASFRGTEMVPYFE